MLMGSFHSSLYILITLGLGALVSIYTPMISASSAVLGSALSGSVLFFFVAFLSSLVLLFIVGDTHTVLNIGNVPPIYLLSGILSAIVIYGVSLVVPVLGLRRFIILMIAGQMLMSVVAGHLEIFGVPRDLLTVKKAIGVVLVLTGVYFTLAE